VTELRKGFGPRLGAFVLDVIITVVCAIAIAAAFGSALGKLVGAEQMAAEAMKDKPADAAESVAVAGKIAAGAPLATMIAILLYGLIEAFTGASLGKMALGMKIANPDATAASVGKLFGRYAVKNGSAMINFLGSVAGVAALGNIGGLWSLAFLIGCFFALGSSKQALHDIIVGTAVYPKAEVK
jgi:uncharacterized RDD family membrane protein YckC